MARGTYMFYLTRNIGLENIKVGKSLGMVANIPRYGGGIIINFMRYTYSKQVSVILDSKLGKVCLTKVKYRKKNKRKKWILQKK
jgi:hypothetical protein